jgi:hypothetical protein
MLAVWSYRLRRRRVSTKLYSTMTTESTRTPTTQQQQQKAIRFGTYNIQSARDGRLETVLRAMGQMGVDWGILTEASKLTRGIHTRFSSRYHVVATEATSMNQSGVALFYHDTDDFQVESVWCHGPNPISFELEIAGRRQPVVGGIFLHRTTILTHWNISCKH